MKANPTAPAEPHPTARTMLDVWFGVPGRPGYGEPRDVWFKVSEAFDQEIRTRFADAHTAAAAGDFDSWTDSPHGALALVLLLDQVPRNIHRGAPDAFATDGRALEVAKDAIRQGHDAALIPVERLFLYLPFQHAEDLVEQERSLALYDRIDLPNMQQFAHRHHDIIARFGRFPHRNAVLGRTSTPEELAFLTEPNSSF